MNYLSLEHSYVCALRASNKALYLWTYAERDSTQRNRVKTIVTSAHLQCRVVYFYIKPLISF